MSSVRQESARIAARMVSRATAATTSLRNLGHALDVHHSTVERWGDSDEPAALTIRDLIAAYRQGEREFAAHVVAQLAAMFDEDTYALSRPVVTACQVSVVAGNVCAVAVAIEADGVVTPTEGERYLEVLREADRAVHAERMAWEKKR